MRLRFLALLIIIPFVSFAKDPILTGADQLSAYSLFKEQIIAGKSEEEIRQSWEPGLSNYKKMRKKHLLYH